MNGASSEIEEFFRAFEINSNLGNAVASAALFAESFLMADPAGARMVSSQSLLVAIPQRKQMVESIGWQTTRLTSICENPLGTHFVLVGTQWRMSFRRDSTPETEVILNTTFILHRAGDSLKIVVYLNDENLMDVLRNRGLLPEVTKSS